MLRVQFQHGLLLDRMYPLRLGALVDGAVRNFEFEGQFHPWFHSTAVVNFVAANAARIRTVPESSTRSPYLLEAEGIENRCFPAEAGICLGPGGRVFESHRPDQKIKPVRPHFGGSRQTSDSTPLMGAAPGEAAEMLGLTRIEFLGLLRLAGVGFEVDLDEEDFEQLRRAVHAHGPQTRQ